MLDHPILVFELALRENRNMVQEVQIDKWEKTSKTRFGFIGL